MIIIFIALILFITLIYIDNKKTLNEIRHRNRIVLYDKDNKPFYETNNMHEGSYLEDKEIPSMIKKIFIHSEDKNFYKHNGFDIYRISSSMLHNSTSGASTITQQLIKNLYFTNNRSYLRKTKELYLSMRLEAIYTKNEILEAYFNTLYFNHNIYGIKDAASFYFNKDVYSLSISEITILANIIKNPTLFSPLLNYERVLIKRNYLLQSLYKAKIINSDELQEATLDRPTVSGIKASLYSDGILYYKDIVLNELKALKIKKDFNQTIKVKTQFNTSLDKLISSEKAKFSSDISIIVTDQNGYYNAILGGKDYQSSTLNIAIDGTRQVNSTIKPLLYYYALENGYTPLSLFSGNKVSFHINGVKMNFSNSGDIYENTLIPMAYALATSDNMYALKLHTALNFKGITSMLNRFNIKSTPHIQQAIGNVSMSFSNLMQIYHSFQTLGIYHEFKAVNEVTVDKKLVFKNYNEDKRVLNKSTTYVLNEMMTLMFDNQLNHKRKVTGSKIASRLNFKVAGKSGSSSTDSYMIGFNPEVLIGIWVGDDELTKLESFLPKDLFSTIFNFLATKNTWYNLESDVVYEYVKVNTFSEYRRNIAFKK